MSYSSLLQQKCNVLRLVETQVDGLISSDWQVVETGAKCFLDLNYLRAGKDPIWTPDSGIAENRSGVLFLKPGTNVRPGDRVQMVKGPTGTFEIKSSIDEAWTPRKLHHLECYVQEVNRVYVPGSQ